MSVKSIEVEIDKNGCSYFPLSLVPIEFILRLHRCLVLAANFGQFANHSLREGYIPAFLKSSIVTPIPKVSPPGLNKI